MAEVARRYADGQDLITIAAGMDITVRQAAKLLEAAAKDAPALDEDALRYGTEIRLDALARKYDEMTRSTDFKERSEGHRGLRQTEVDRARLLGLNTKPGP